MTVGTDDARRGGRSVRSRRRTSREPGATTACACCRYQYGYVSHILVSFLHFPALRKRGLMRTSTRRWGAVVVVFSPSCHYAVLLKRARGTTRKATQRIGSTITWAKVLLFLVIFIAIPAAFMVPSWAVFFRPCASTADGNAAPSAASSHAVAATTPGET